jgi:uncharacterized protein YqeY
MVTLKEKLADILKQSMKSQDKDKLAFARNLHAAIRKKEIDAQMDMTDPEFQKVVTTLVKQRKESIEQFQKGHRDDLVQKETEELMFLEQFLPEQLSEGELTKLISEAISEAGAKQTKDMGAVMKILMPKIQGKADAKWVNQRVRESLG